MDSRDIKETPVFPADGKYLESIYSMQEELLDDYIKIEGLPQYPINVNTKKSQIILKDFTSRIIEELAESYESLVLIDSLSKENRLWFPITDSNLKQFVQCLNHLQNASEEISDAMHFMMELLIYTNIRAEDINSYIDKWVDKNIGTGVLNVMNTNNIIDKAMVLGNILLLRDNQMTDIDEKNIVDLFKKYNDLLEDGVSIPKYDEQLLKCGSLYNTLLYEDYKKLLWDITYHLNISRNFLKNKPWKQSQMMTNEVAYQEEIVKSFILFMGTICKMGIDCDNLYYIYFKKNKVNKFRIKSKY